MQVVETIPDLKRALEGLNGETLGFVPTMGALHEGHHSLVSRSVKDNKHTAVSIFVNPTQFNDPTDFERYPRDQAADLTLLEDAGVDLVFLPSEEDMYPKGSMISINPGPLENEMCGMSRPGHFRGVLTVVAKLFHMLQPSTAYFGQKDYQQFLLISKMVTDLNFPVELIMGETVREESGLAMSSRNELLSSEQRDQAPMLYQALKMAQTAVVQGGETQGMKAIEKAMDFLIMNSSFEIDYFVLVNPFNLKDLIDVTPKTPFLVATAAYLQPIRLIDNLLYFPDQR